MPQPTHLTREDAAALCGCSVATIRRYQRDGKLETRLESGRTEVTVASLIAAGLLGEQSEEKAAARTAADRELVERRTEVAVLAAKLDAAETRIADLTGQVGFLRTLVTGQAAA